MTIRRFSEWMGNSKSDGIQQELANLDGRMRDLERDIGALSAKLSQGDGPIADAFNRLRRHWEVLFQTLQHAVDMDSHSPELSDHPPISNS